MDISIYLEPLNNAPGMPAEEFQKENLGDYIQKFDDPDHFPDISQFDIAIIGVDEDRNCQDNTGCGKAPNLIREEFYLLKRGHFSPKIVDLGNLKRGHEITDTYYALTSVVTQLINQNVIPLILGGSQDLTFANYNAYETLGKVVNILAVDNSFDMGKTEDEIHSGNYLNKIILKQPNFLFNYTNLGYQSYFVDPGSIKLMDSLFFDIYRLGTVRENIAETEPLIRNADIVSVDISAVRNADAPGCMKASPNGFYGEEICQITRYAGMSDKVSSIGFYEMNPEVDINNQTAKLIAQMMWYFVDGFYNRKEDHPHHDKEDFVKYTVSIKDHKDQLVFYKSKKSDRWWMDVPVKKNYQNVYERHHMVPCSYSDYETACRDDIPDRWWQAYQKLM